MSKWEVQHYTMCDGWVNTWSVIENGKETPQQFDTELEAQSELDEFFNDINLEIEYGEREPEHGYDRDEFQIVEVTK